MRQNDKAITSTEGSVYDDKIKPIAEEIVPYAKRAPILICAITKRTYSDNGIPHYPKLHLLKNLTTE
jgi:hypothetical protein